MKKLTAGIFATLLTVVAVDGAYAAIASQGYVDDKVGEVETTVAGKQDKLSQTGSASQPVYVNAEGKVTAGNTIPSVTTNITTGQTDAAQAGAVAEALATKANTADLADYVTETEANAAYAVKALEGQVGTVSAENMGTTATTVVTAIKEVATEAANAASAASAAQGDVDALEAVVNNETTGLAAAHTAIDALESGKLDATGIAARATADADGNVITTTYATKAEIADMATDENLAKKQDKTDESLATTNKTVVGAINEVKTQADKGVSDAATAKSAADAAQETATQAKNDAATAQEAAETAQTTAEARIPKPSGECSNPTAKCVLVSNGTNSFEWEVIARGTGETGAQ